MKEKQLVKDLEMLFDSKKRNPYEKLWFAVLMQAMEDLQDEKFKQKAEKWFKSNSSKTGSFLWICNYLEFNAEEIRENLGIQESNNKGGE